MSVRLEFLRLLKVHAELHGIELIQVDNVDCEFAYWVARQAVLELRRAFDETGDTLGTTCEWTTGVVVSGRRRPKRKDRQEGRSLS